jgi:1-acyl-sn-glycerol-3-phosphate acyltransferase
MKASLYHIGRWAVRAFLFIFTRFEVKGRENVPASGGVLVSANHLSLMDPPVVGVSLGRSTIFMAKEELFRSGFGRYFISAFGAFPVRRGRLDREALRRAEKALSDSQALVMFPQGARASSDGYRPEGFIGAALIAARSGVSVLPVGITGTEKMKGWGWMLRRPRITVNIGPAFQLSPGGGKGRHDQLEEQTRAIMDRIADLLPPKYRGVNARSLGDRAY